VVLSQSFVDDRVTKLTIQQLFPKSYRDGRLIWDSYLLKSPTLSFPASPFRFLLRQHSTTKKKIIMNVKELVTSKLDGLISADQLKAIDHAVQKYENQKLASAKSDESKEWTLVGTTNA
jgi:hypothetical protein